MTKLKYIRSGSSLDSCLLGLCTWSSPSTLGLETCQTHVYLGSVCGRPKYVEPNSLPDPSVGGLPPCYWTFLDKVLGFFTKRQKY